MTRGLAVAVTIAAAVLVWAAIVLPFAFRSTHHALSERALLEAQAVQAVSVYASQQSWEITRVHVTGYSQVGAIATVDVAFLEGTDPGDITVHFRKSPWSLVGLN